MVQFEQTCLIAADPTTVEHCIVEPDSMRKWLNPMLECRSIGPWRVDLGSRFRFIIRVPPYPALDCLVSDRHRGIIEWSFQGFFEGTDRWECRSHPAGTLLVNCFRFDIPNPLVKAGFNLFEGLTRHDMHAQLQRIKTLAESN